MGTLISDFVTASKSPGEGMAASEGDPTTGRTDRGAAAPADNLPEAPLEGDSTAATAGSEVDDEERLQRLRELDDLLAEMDELEELEKEAGGAGGGFGVGTGGRVGASSPLPALKPGDIRGQAAAERFKTSTLSEFIETTKEGGLHLGRSFGIAVGTVVSYYVVVGAYRTARMVWQDAKEAAIESGALQRAMRKGYEDAGILPNDDKIKAMDGDEDDMSWLQPSDDDEDDDDDDDDLGLGEEDTAALRARLQRKGVTPPPGGKKAAQEAKKILDEVPPPPPPAYVKPAKQYAKKPARVFDDLPVAGEDEDADEPPLVGTRGRVRVREANADGKGKAAGGAVEPEILEEEELRGGGRAAKAIKRPGAIDVDVSPAPFTEHEVPGGSFYEGAAGGGAGGGEGGGARGGEGNGTMVRSAAAARDDVIKAYGRGELPDVAAAEPREDAAADAAAGTAGGGKRKPRPAAEVAAEWKSGPDPYAKLSDEEFKRRVDALPPLPRIKAMVRRGTATIVEEPMHMPEELYQWEEGDPELTIIDRVGGIYDHLGEEVGKVNITRPEELERGVSPFGAPDETWKELPFVVVVYMTPAEEAEEEGLSVAEMAEREREAARGARGGGSGGGGGGGGMFAIDLSPPFEAVEAAGAPHTPLMSVIAFEEKRDAEILQILWRGGAGEEGAVAGDPVLEMMAPAELQGLVAQQGCMVEVVRRGQLQLRPGMAQSEVVGVIIDLCGPKHWGKYFADAAKGPGKGGK